MIATLHDETRRIVITIVSGLPRSGTSMMMQMLAVGGIPILSDGERQPDTDNPRGYFEWEKIKQLPQQPDCIREAEGKIVKVISQLLFSLPVGPRYQVVFMERPLAEIVASQTEMIRRRATPGPTLSATALIAGLQAHLNQVSAWLKTRRDISVFRVNYQDVLQSPQRVADNLQQFLNCPLDVGAMVQQVDPSLYRQRSR